MLLHFYVHLVCKFKRDHILQVYFANTEPPLLALLNCLLVSKPMLILEVARLYSLRSRILVPMETGLPIWQVLLFLGDCVELNTFCVYVTVQMWCFNLLWISVPCSEHILKDMASLKNCCDLCSANTYFISPCSFSVLGKASSWKCQLFSQVIPNLWTQNSVRIVEVMFCVQVAAS